MLSFLLSMLIYCSLSHATDAHPPWVHSARKLIGENAATRKKALEQLQVKFSDLDQLIDELDGPYRPYALDVIVAMNPDGAADALLKKVGKDRDGSITLAVNALLNKDNFQRIASYYTGYLDTSLDSLPTPVIMAMVDFLTHIRRPCAKSLCGALLRHPRLEVQQAGALHLAVVPVEGKYQILREHFANLFPQVRTQAMLTFFQDGYKKEAKELCKADSDPILQSACESLIFEKPTPPKKEVPKAKKKAKK